MTPPASDRVRRSWSNRVVAEYRSAALTAELLHWLIELGVSPDTLAVAHRIVSDELAHAELSREVLTLAGGGEVAIDRATLRSHLEPAAPIELRALAVCARTFCCGETVAVPLFRALRAEARVERTWPAFDRILADEAVHRAFGWDLLDELLERLGDPGRAWLTERVPAYVDGLRRAYRDVGDAFPDADRAWGLMPSGRFAAITDACVRETILPWFARRGVA